MLTQWGGRRCEWFVVIGAMTLLVCNIFMNVSSKCPVIDPSISKMTRKSCPATTTPTVPIHDPIAKLDLRLGRWDITRVSRIFDYAAVGDLYSEISLSNLVCLATHTSIETLTGLLNITSHWSGPVSVAVYVAADEMTLLRGFVTWLMNCQPDTYSRLAIHIATPYENPAVIENLPHWARNCSKIPTFSGQRSKETIEWRVRNKFPQNVLRNLARKNCHTQFVYLVDIDIVPCKGMADSLEKFLKTSNCLRCAYVIPTYELHWNVTSFPENKAGLLKLVENGKAVAYHSKVFRSNQKSSNLSLWESSNDEEDFETYVSHDVTEYDLLYEPFYVARDSVPPHDERFFGYGYTSNSQVYEMFLKGYQFKVLSPIFTIHWGLSISDIPRWRIKQNWKNYMKFKTVQKELHARYNKDPLFLFTEKNTELENATK